MYITNGIKATLIQNNRGTSDYYDDQDKKEKQIVVCPYNVDESVNFSAYSVPEAKGYFIIKRKVDVKEGDQLKVGSRLFSILDVQDDWIWNKVANIRIAVK